MVRRGAEDSLDGALNDLCASGRAFGVYLDTCFLNNGQHESDQFVSASD